MRRKKGKRASKKVYGSQRTHQSKLPCRCGNRDKGDHRKEPIVSDELLSPTHSAHVLCIRMCRLVDVVGSLERLVVVRIGTRHGGQLNGRFFGHGGLTIRVLAPNNRVAKSNLVVAEREAQRLKARLASTSIQRRREKASSGRAHELQIKIHAEYLHGLGLEHFPKVLRPVGPLFSIYLHRLQGSGR